MLLTMYHNHSINFGDLWDVGFFLTWDFKFSGALFLKTSTDINVLLSLSE